MMDFFNYSIKEILINKIDHNRNSGNVEEYQHIDKVIFEIHNGLAFELKNGSIYSFGFGYNNNQYAVELCKIDTEAKVGSFLSINESNYYNLLSKLIGKQIVSIKPEIQVTFRDSPQLRSIKFYSKEGVEFAILGEDNFQTSKEQDLPIFDGCWIIIDKEIIELI